MREGFSWQFSPNVVATFALILELAMSGREAGPVRGRPTDEQFSFDHGFLQ